MDWVALVVIVGGVTAVAFVLDASGKRYCFNKLKKAGAFSPEKAVTFEEADIEVQPWTRQVFRTFVKKGKVGMTEDGRFYLSMQNNRPR